ncbi:hypothetical protein PDG61_03045 [Mycolicibacterium sp. BiH015]|uniref:hypothetical protein n=1 Tax=Mycolicibacterium sp. BiH015 TaxID=3018808 RepID=UPI0022E8FECD|nr:hypothetical protein [Mycolicibacterium sp. BiH015]MDA2889878.1 hypothetical protein [Mycolicibacterium sp. BiH015]
MSGKPTDTIAQAPLPQLAEIGDSDNALAFAEGVSWRVSKRGLIVCTPGGSPLLIAHDRAGEIPALIRDAATLDDVKLGLGGTGADCELVDALVAEQVISDQPLGAIDITPVKRVTFSRSGIEFTGIDSIARRVHRVVMPVIESWSGRFALTVIVIAGLACLIMGRPDGPQVSSDPWVDATVGMLLGFALSGLHELGHAVALVHYGRTPRSAGCGFYWGAMCFYVDCSDGITLPKRARIVNALAGLAVDLVTMSVLLIMTHTVAGSVLLVSVCWRLAITQLIGIFENGMPILEVDGHIALSDYLDEPDLSPRSREALSRKLRGVTENDEPLWLAGYGAFSIIGGIVLLVGGTWAWWLAAGDLVSSLFGGNVIEILLGLYLVVPVAMAALFSGIGLALELTSKAPATEAGQS